MSVRERMMGYDSRTGHRSKVSPSEILGGVSFPLLRRPDQLYVLVIRRKSRSSVEQEKSEADGEAQKGAKASSKQSLITKANFHLIPVVFYSLISYLKYEWSRKKIFKVLKLYKSIYSYIIYKMHMETKYICIIYKYANMMHICVWQQVKHPQGLNEV